MLKLSLDLPKYRLHLRLAKRRDSYLEEALFPSLEEIKNTRSGNKVSRFFRHIFEHKQIKKILGGNFAILVIATSFIPAHASSNFEAAEAIISENQTPLTTEPGAQYPVRKIKINQGYRFFHPGLDLDGITGEPIYPIKPGIVEAIDHSRFAYGNAVIINHGNQITSLYAHLSEIEVGVNQKVDKFTEIGKMGSTGHSSGDHLHLEIRDHGRPINPFSVLPR